MQVILHGCSSLPAFKLAGTYPWFVFLSCLFTFTFFPWKGSLIMRVSYQNFIFGLEMYKKQIRKQQLGKGKNPTILQVHFIITTLWSLVLLTYIRKIPWRILSPFIISWKSLVSLTLLWVQCLMSHWFKEFYRMSSKRRGEISPESHNI